MKKSYVIRFEEAEKPDYLYHIAFCNLLGKGVTYSAICTPQRVLAMRFRKKYLAEAFAKLTKGEVEAVGDVQGVELAEWNDFTAFDADDGYPIQGGN